jgi:hypothetical protein
MRETAKAPALVEKDAIGQREVLGSNGHAREASKNKRADDDCSSLS